MLLQDLELEVEEQEGNRGGLQDFFLKKANWSSNGAKMCWCREFGDQKGLRLPLTDVKTLWFQTVAFTCHALQTLETVKKKITCNSPPLHSIFVDPSKVSSNPLSIFGPLEMHPLLPLHLICGMHFFLLPRQWSPWGQGPHLLQSCVCCIDQQSVWHIVYSKWFRYEPSEGQKLNPACGRLTFVPTFNN